MVAACTNCCCLSPALLPAQVIYVEAISNPLMEIPDLPAVVAFAKHHGLVSLIDATFATPVNLQPAVNPGFDVVLHSATKYLNGHSDLIAGTSSVNFAAAAVIEYCCCYHDAVAADWQRQGMSLSRDSTTQLPAPAVWGARVAVLGPIMAVCSSPVAHVSAS